MSQQKGLIVERILRDRESIWRQVIEERQLGRMVGSMLLTSFVCLAAYGAVLGASHSWAQAVSSALKLPLLFLATLVICLPTLYLFNLIFGARLGMLQAISLIMVSITVMAVMVLAFAPISLFFLITANNYEFFKLLNVAIMVLAAIVGLRFLTSGMARLNEYQAALAAQRAEREAALAAAPTSPAPAGSGAAAASESVSAGADGAGSAAAGTGPAGTGTAVAVLPKAPVVIPSGAFPRPTTTVQPATRPASMTLLYIWIALFGFVGTQLAWTLRPFFGSPHEPFEPFRDIEGTFYSDIIRTIGDLFGG
jgi:hypothetical protein